MTYNRTYPQIFLDTNALVKVAYSISHHYRDPQGRKSALRVFMERGVITFTTGVLQFARALELIAQGTAETSGFSLDEAARRKVIEEIAAATGGPNPLLRLVASRDLEILDECRRLLHRSLAQNWIVLVDWDEEDKLMIYEATLAYARYGVIRTSKGTYRPRPMILATDDLRVHEIAERLDHELKSALLEIPCISPLQSQYITKIIHIMSYNDLKKLIQEL